MRGYRQIHCDLDLTRQANLVAGLLPLEIDGVAILCFADLESFTGAQEASTEFSQRARVSESEDSMTRTRAVATSPAPLTEAPTPTTS